MDTSGTPLQYVKKLKGRLQLPVLHEDEDDVVQWLESTATR